MDFKIFPRCVGFSSESFCWYACVLYQGAWVQVVILLPIPASCSCTPWEAAGNGSSIWFSASCGGETDWVPSFQLHRVSIPAVTDILEAIRSMGPLCLSVKPIHLIRDASKPTSLTFHFLQIFQVSLDKDGPRGST